MEKFFAIAVLFAAVHSTTVFAQSAPAADPGCLDPARIQKAMAEYQLLSWNPALGTKGDWQPVQSVDPCDQKNLEHLVVASLLFIEDFPTGSFPQDDFDQNIMGGSPIDFFKTRIHTIQFEGEQSYSCKGMVVGFVSDSQGYPNTMHVCPYALQFSLLDIASVLMHESRHIDGFAHSICENGLYEGNFACDPSYATKGSYAVGVEFDVKVHRNPNLSPAIREEARASAISDLMVRFNEAPLGIKPGIWLFSEDGTMSFFDGTQNSVLLTGIASSVVPVVRDVPAFYDTATGAVTGYSGRVPMTDLPGAFAQEFRDMSKSKQQTLLDVTYGDVGCLLFTDTLHCEVENDSFDWPMPAGFKPIQFMPIAPASLNIIYIAGEDGQTYQLPTDTNIKTWTNDKIKKNDDIPIINDFKSLQMLKGVHFAISRDGTLVWIPGQGNSWTPDPDFQGQRYRKMAGPYFWSSRLIEL